MSKLTVVGIGLDGVDYSDVLDLVHIWVNARNSRSLCFANVHMLMEAHDSLVFRQVLSYADLVVPDGVPLVWLLRMKGNKKQQRVYGPSLMLNLLDDAAGKGIPVGFYGSAPDVLDALTARMKERFPSLKIVYSYSPPYQALDETQRGVIIREINQSGVNLLFVGLGCPKQELWMAEHRGKINAVMLGVGAAFDFHAGVKPQAPAWMQRVGLEWLYRLGTEPRRLWRRYLYHNPRFIVLAILDLIGLLK